MLHTVLERLHIIKAPEDPVEGEIEYPLNGPVSHLASRRPSQESLLENPFGQVENPFGSDASQSANPLGPDALGDFLHEGVLTGPFQNDPEGSLQSGAFAVGAPKRLFPVEHSQNALSESQAGVSAGSGTKSLPAKPQRVEYSKEQLEIPVNLQGIPSELTTRFRELNATLIRLQAEKKQVPDSEREALVSKISRTQEKIEKEKERLEGFLKNLPNKYEEIQSLQNKLNMIRSQPNISLTKSEYDLKIAEYENEIKNKLTANQRYIKEFQASQLEKPKEGG